LRLEKSAPLQLPSKQKAEKQKISIPLLYFAQQKTSKPMKTNSLA
jgi:hypothetical protein